MSEFPLSPFKLPPEKEALRDRHFHPSGTFVDFPKEDVEKSIPERFEKIVQLYSDRMAVKMGDRSITYDELNRAANRIARAITALRGEATEPIALLFENGIDVIAAILGSLKARKFFVALDPSLPFARIIGVLQHSQSSLIVTAGRHLELARKLAGDDRTLLNSDEIDVSLCADDLGLPISPENLASIQYTSGSTGKPKGVAHSHRSQLHTVMINTNEVRLCCQDRLTLLHSVGFTAAQAHLFQSLLNGASLHVFDLKSEGIHGLSKWLKQESLTIYHSPPTVFRQLAETMSAEENFSSLRLIRLSGAPVNRLDFDLYAQKLAPGALLQIVLNSTEANVISSFVTDGTFCFPENGAPVGYPVRDKEVRLLDENGLDVAPGDVGEICVKSHYLPPGYLENSASTTMLTRSSADGVAEAMCLTGDLGRFLPDGLLIHLGRKDSMVKVRGYRVELSEIERALQDHPEIKEVSVVAWERGPGDKIPVAYVVLRGSPPPAIGELHDFLKTRLPEYMAPGRFMFLDSLPLTNGKLDRTALPSPDHRRPELNTLYVGPRNDLEKTIAQIWADVLALDRVGIHDNFFDLGGHSLAAMRVVTRTRDVLRAEISLVDVFENPTVAALAARLERHQASNPATEIAAVAPARREQPLALSFGQEGLWLHDQLEPETCRYNFIVGYELRGRLDVTALEQSFDEIIKRHEALRTVFPAVDGQPHQVILPASKLVLPVVDLRGTVTEEDRQLAVSRFALAENHRPFDLTRGPLLRPMLLRLGDDRFALLIVLHHLIFDGWSADILARELSALYGAFVRGKLSPLQPLSVQYADFALWQRQSLAGEILDGQLAYWKEQLADLPVLRLPTDRARPRKGSGRGAQHWFTLSPAVSRSLKETGRQAGATPFMTLLAAFQTLLSRYTGQADICVGISVAGRQDLALESLIGFFLNMLVLRVDLSDNPSFRDLLGRVRESCLKAYAHKDLPFEKLVEELHPERDPSRHPLFQVSFNFRSLTDGPMQLHGLVVKKLDIDPGALRFDLQLLMEESENGLRGYWMYSLDLFDPPTIDRMAASFQALLEGIVADPQQRIGALPLLARSEKRRILVDWNNTEKDYPRDKCIHELFERQVHHSPDAMAMICGDLHLTYGELNKRANQLAHYLTKQGVGPETVVGLCAGRSMEMVIGLLAILKAGGAYLPLDSECPLERLAFMLEDTQARVLLTQERFSENRGSKIEDGNPPSLELRSEKASIPSTESILSLAEGLRTGPDSRLKVICLDRDWEAIAQESAEDVPSGVIPENLAYVLYTSGSTGAPKGVAVEQKSLVNYSVDIAGRLQPDIGDQFAMVQPLTVDSCITMIFPCWIAGGTLHVISRDMALSATELDDYFQRWSIHFLKIAPSHLAALQAATSPARLMPRRCLIIGGEGSRWDWAQSLQTLAPSCAIFNHYGPTETTVGVLTYRVRAGESNTEHSLGTPLGRPIANTQVYIVDAHMNPVPIGVTGELCIGGAGVARGYLNRPELTAEQFITHSFDGEPAQRLYRTGDLARYLSDGNIEFIGRIDDQIKIHGFRIEPGEIEAALAGHPNVGQSVVIVREEEPGDVSGPLVTSKRLVAYFVSKQEPAPTTRELRAFLQQKLPHYMVPLDFVLLDGLPRTPHGKVNRSVLPVPRQSRPELEETYVPPRTPIEELAAEIWAEVLKREKVGVHDNFFELGGHSLLATRLISRVRDTFGLELPLRSLFESPTVAGLALQMDLAREGEARARALPIDAEPGDHEYPLSFSQERFWFLSQLEPDNLAYKTTRGFRLRGPLDVEALERALSEIVGRHETLRTTFERHNGRLIQKISDRWSMQLSIRDLTQDTVVDADVEIQRIFDSEHRRFFDLSADLLLRPQLVRQNVDEHVLFLSTHHMASDHWSIEIFLRELSTLYEAFANAKTSPLSELPIQYKHYAFWQRKMFQGRELEEHLAYWKRQLAGAPPFLDLPTDHPRKPLQNRQGGRQTLVLPKGLEDALRSLGREAGVTFFMRILAAFQTLLHRLTGESDIVVGTPVAGRDRSETEGLIGLFLNSLALRTNLSGNPTFLELLTRVREVALGAYNHQELPFEKLVEELQPQRDLSSTPFFQVFINMYNFKEVSLELDRLTVTSLNRSTAPTPQFDLEFFVRQRDDEVQFAFVYDTDLFESATIARLVAHFQVLLEGIAADPGRRISDLPILTEAEKHQLLVEWNETERDYPKAKCVHQLFEEQVERTPEAVAVVFDDRQLTYRELNSRANQLAHYLRQRGVQPDTIVALCMERSIEMVVGILGVLKAGGAYLPIDPDAPAERRRFLLDDAQADLLLTQDKLCLSFAGGTDEIVCLDSEWYKLLDQSHENLQHQVRGHHAAYVIYTSGSTGTPKGVVNVHRGLLNRLQWMQDAYRLTDVDRVLQKTPFTFDVSVWELLWPLISGACLVVARPGGHRDGAYLVRLIQSQQITTLHFVPSMLEVFLRESEVDCCTTLRQVVCSGEALSYELQQRFFDRSTAALHNLYGPTEASIDVTAWECSRDSDRSVVPIGRPIANTQIYILDPHLKPVPIGVVGELHIGGIGLARGYLNRRELTAEKFVADPFSDHPGARLYKTGDLARYLPDGNIEFLGRTDNQVKIRGFRIELGEIECVLAQHPAIQQAVLLVRENARDDTRLVAYMVATAGSNPSANDLRSFLQHKLPDYMVPSAFVFLDSLPLTPNGKLDRKALPAPDHGRPELDDAFVAPRNPVEAILADIWAEVLELEKVGIHDNFFYLGGHSLLATQIISRMRNAFSMEVPLRQVFDAPTIAEMATIITENQGKRAKASSDATRDRFD